MRKKNKEKIYSEKVEKMVDDMTLFDDDLMSRVFDGNIPATRLLIRTILQKKVDVIDSKGQWDMKNPLVNGRCITLDIFAKDSKGRHFNCEVQRTKAGANPKRARFHSAMVDTHILKGSHDFKEIKDSYVIFITESDFYNQGKPIYLIERKCDNGINFNDGNHIIYVNGQYKGKDKIGLLLEDFRRKETTGFNNPELENGVRHFKINKEGRKAMCEAVEKYAKEKYKDGAKDGAKNAITQSIESMLRRGKTVEEIVDFCGYTYEQVKSVEDSILQKA